MEGGVLDDRQIADPDPRVRGPRLLEDVADPVLGVRMNSGQVLEAEALAESTPELRGNSINEIEELAVAHGISRLGRKPAASVFPLVSRAGDRPAHGVSGSAAALLQRASGHQRSPASARIRSPS